MGAVQAGRDRRGLGRSFGLLLSASAVSTIGNGLAIAAFPLLATRLTTRPLLVSVVTAAGTAPWLLFGLLGGAVIDRSDRRRVMWVTDGVRTLVVGGLALAVIQGAVQIWSLALFAAAIGVGTTLFDGASQAMVPALVGTGDVRLGRANARLYGAEVVGEQFAGPALGGVCFALATSLPFALDAVSFAASAALVASLPGRYRAAAPVDDGDPAAEPGRPGGAEQIPLRRAVAEGIAWLAHHPFLRSLALAIGATNLALGMAEAVLVLLAERRFGVHARGYGLLLATMAVGGVAASLTATPLARRLGRSGVLRSSLVVLAGGILLAGLAPDAAICAVGLALLSFAAVLFSVVAVSLRQALIPDAMMGRVVSAFRVVGMGASPVGALVGGAVAAVGGLRSAFVVGAVVTAVVAVVTWRLFGGRSLASQLPTT